VPKRKSINEEIHKFQDTQEKNVQVVAPFEAKTKINKSKSKKGYIQKKSGES
jgi:hypothetical protein